MNFIFHFSLFIFHFYNMDRGIVSGRYANALLMHAAKYGIEQDVYRETKWLSRCISSFPQIKRILTSPVISGSKKKDMLERLFPRPLSDEFRNFIRIVLENKREELLQAMCLMYQEYYRNEKRILQVELVTAAPVAEEAKAKIIQKMENLTHESIRLTYTVDPKILGGYILFWDTYRWDASVASRMRQIEKNIMETIKNI